MKAYAATVQDAMQTDHAHGNQTGAAEAGYRCFVVGRGETGAGAVASSVAAVNAKNPGAAETGSASISGELGAVLTNTASYQRDIETQRAGAGATIGPALQAHGDGFTQAFAEGAARGL